MPIRAPLALDNACVELFKSIDNGDNDASLFWLQTISDQTISDQTIKDMSCLSQPNSHGETMLTLAIGSGHSMNEFILALINTGHSNPNYVRSVDADMGMSNNLRTFNDTALILATRMNNPVVVVALLGVNSIAVEHKDSDGKTALDYAKENDDTYPVILYALRAGIRPNGGSKHKSLNKLKKTMRKKRKKGKSLNKRKLSRKRNRIE